MYWNKRRNLLLFKLLGGVVWAASLILCGVPATAQPASPPPAVSASAPADNRADAYTLDVGDKLRLIVFGEADLGGEYVVDGSGDVRLPLIGQVRAAGLPLAKFEEQVKTALEKGYLKNAKVSAEVIGYRPFYILGQVNKPGEYGFVNGMNVLTAIALAGGYTHRASDTNVFIRHKGSNQEQAAPADQTTKVMPGDIIRVRERFF
jgi:polysaccharide export outer membrane protein